jgi:tetratricopeptide (TPR) repeat protein
MKAFASDFAVHEYSISDSDIPISLNGPDTTSNDAVANLVKILLARAPSSRPHAAQVQAMSAHQRLLSLGYTFQKQKHYYGAIEVYKLAIEDDPDDPVAGKRLGDAYKAINNYDEAAKAYRTSIVAGFTEPTVHADLGTVLHVNGDYYAATEQYQMALQDDPDNIAWCCQLGRAYVSVADYQIAIWTFRKAIKANPSNAVVLQNLAETYVINQNFDLAVKIFRSMVTTYSSSFNEARIRNIDVLKASGKPNSDKWFSRLGGRKVVDKRLGRKPRRGERPRQFDDTNSLHEMHSLALLYKNQGQIVKACELEERLLKSRTIMFGAEHDDTLKSMEVVAEFYFDGREKESAELLEKLLDIRRKLEGDESLDTLRTMGYLALLYKTQIQMKKFEDLKMRIDIINKNIIKKN